MTNTSDPMAEIRASFFIECEELLEALQDGLQDMEVGAHDSETINVVFRAVHSIKGGAGAFGLEELVRFAHRFETILDEVRTERMAPDAAAVKVFFQSADHLSDLVRMSRDSGNMPKAETLAKIALLDALLDTNNTAEEKSSDKGEIDFEPIPLALDLNKSCEDVDTGGTGSASSPLSALHKNRYLIKFAPDSALYETGNEPFLILRALNEMGECVVTCDTGNLPPLADLTPEASYLYWTIDLQSNSDEAEIASVFEYVEGICSLDISTLTGDREGIPPSRELNVKPVMDQPSGSMAQPSFSGANRQGEPTFPHQTPPVQAASAAKKTSLPRTQDQRATAAAPTKAVVRVDIDRIETLVNLVGELVINQAVLSQSLESAGLQPHSDAMNGLEEFQRLTRDIQDSVMMIRAQPVKPLFQRMSRIVREASVAVGKDVRLVTDGEGTEIDRTVIERLADPLTHMIRNAVDHGLETAKERVSVGKPAQGRVKLSATHRSGRVIIEVTDDGSGINRPKILQIARDKGLVARDATLLDNEIDNLLFLPGFSTTEVVSDLSGRGVGMDVVQTAIKALGGKITISSTLGVGTTFTISLPLTLAVLDGMIIQVADETLVLPLNSVIETLALTNNDVEMVRPGENVVRVRSSFVPLFDLGYELGYRAAIDDYDGSVVLLITHDDESSVALVIDTILDQRQVVIKGLGDSFYRAPGIAAATILGDGQIALILDASDLISNAIKPNASVSKSEPAGISA